MKNYLSLILALVFINPIAFAAGRTTQDIYLSNKSDQGGRSCYIQDSTDSSKKGAPMPAGSNPGYQYRYVDFATKSCPNKSDQKIHQMNVYCGGELVCVIQTITKICINKKTDQGVIQNGKAAVTFKKASSSSFIYNCATPIVRLYENDNNIYFYIPVQGWQKQ